MGSGPVQSNELTLLDGDNECVSRDSPQDDYFDEVTVQLVNFDCSVLG